MRRIELGLRCPAPRPARLRAGFLRRFVGTLALFLILGGGPLLHVSRQIWAVQALQREGQAITATVLHRHRAGMPGMRSRTLECGYLDGSGRLQTARVSVSRSWWQACPVGSRVTITTCDEVPGWAALGEPGEIQLATELGLTGYGMLLLGMLALLHYGNRLRPYFRDLALASLGTPVLGRVVGKSWKLVRPLGRKKALPMVHFHFRDPYGVERVRTQIVSGDQWAHITEGESLTILVCSRRRGGFAAYPLLLAEAVPPRPEPAVALRTERG
jgi:hypothetical protein